MTMYKTVCNSEQCCQVSVDTDTGMETMLSCTGVQNPTYKLD